jgi:glycosyltransferase involved in cell wall biosynthesis
MILGIDAHCIRGVGGSITHLRELLRVANPAASGFTKVVLWSGKTTLDQIDDRAWLVKAHDPMLDKGLAQRTYWSSSKVSSLARKEGCDVLWLPGCSFAGSFRPYVAMSRNMLPFDWREMMRYRFSPRFLKFFLLRFSQSRTYRRSDGMIYLTEYARDRVSAVIGRPRETGRVIPHGIETQFAPATGTGAPARKPPWRLLYVSAVDLYKHQWRVVEAVSLLQGTGLDVQLVLIGPNWPEARRKLHHAMKRFAVVPGSVTYLGVVKHAELHKHYQQADVFVYASSCENLPNILLEAMASAMPVACSSRGPMPEVLKDAGVYFDPERAQSIAAAVRELIDSPTLRREKSELALLYSGEYSWRRCAQESFDYLAQIANEYRGSTAN